MRAGWRLRTRLAVIQIGFALLVAMLFAAATGVWLYGELEQQFVQEQANLLELFAAQGFHAVYISDDDAALFAKEIVDSLVGGNVLYAQIVKDGQTISQRNPLNLPLATSAVPVGVTHNKRQATALTYLDFTRGLIGRPNQGEPVTSYVRLGISLAPLTSIFGQQAWVLGWITLGVMGVGGLLGWLIYRDLWHPIGRLTEAVQAFGKGALSAQAQVDRSDELGQLAQAFNTMAKRIGEKNQELEQLNRALHKANRAKTEFLSTMSHELRTPLNGILGYADLLLQGSYGALSDNQLHPVKSLQRSAEHLLGLIENTLSFAKLELGVEKLHLEQVLLDRVLDEVVEQLRPFALNKGIKVVLKVAGPIALEADRLKLKQVLLNLVQNALQYTPANGRVCIDVEHDEEQVCLRVRDSGPGVDVQALDRLFEPYTRGQGAQGQAAGGVGLGLTIVQRYVTMHGGRVQVSAQSKAGTTFIIVLPRVAASDNQDEAIGGSA